MLRYVELAFVALAAGMLSAAGAMYPYAQHMSYQSDLSYRRPNCKAIPPAMALCHDVGYPEMRLPNLLGHESMREALQQASSWVPLLAKRCHPDTKKFLCSVFAPVCIDELEDPIWPCRSLCEAVRDSCAPVMAAFGFPWPDMLDCERFPVDNDLCIPAATGDEMVQVIKEEPKVCEPCLFKDEDDNEIVENFCKNDFALKMKVKEISYMNGDTKIVPEVKSKTVYKFNGISDRELKRTVLWLKDGLQCTCDEMNDINAPYLVMGRRQAGKLVITSVKRWQKGEREFRRIARSIRKLQC
ncbi:secreted frizzled-related protein 2 [Petromyzon marinus]|uniref:Secreted frizzled-related protein 2 n=1 Tax=Petromyzon marinus TaxID=7757 RepID=A0AAJ7WWI1_PETMA|nr:secreted frizzled-related protein 2 [Petromyzon marinus]